MTDQALPPAHPGAASPYPATPDPLDLDDAAFEAAYGDEYPPLGYHLLHRAGHASWWRALLGALVLGGIMVIVAPLVWLAPFLVYVVASGQDLGAWLTRLGTLQDPTPAMFAYLMLSLASLIPAAWFVQRVFHGLRPRWLSSVGPRLRWRYLLVCVGLSVVALLATLVVGAVLPGEAVTGGSTGPSDPASTVLAFAVTVVLLVPFQAAGEEYFFRGYLTQALGGVFGAVWVAVLVPALLFALAHGLGQSVPVFFDRFAFGIVAGVLVVLTGGLEAAIAMHVLNNLLAFGLALAFSDIGSTLTPTTGSWWLIPSTLTQSVTYLLLAVWAARRMGVARQATGRALVAAQRRV